MSFNLKEKDTLVIQFITLLTDASSKPIWIITLLTNLHTTRSYALLISSSKGVVFVRRVELHIVEDLKSYQSIMRIKRLGMKELWFMEMFLFKNCFSLFASTFEIILDMTLQELMGKKSVIIFGSLHFGIRDMHVLFIPSRRILHLHQFFPWAATSKPTITQKF